MNKILKSSKGAFSILAVIVVFILVLGMTAFIDITTKTYILNEIQGNMDMAGITALHTAVDRNKLRAEMMAYSDGSNNSIDVDDRSGVVIKRTSQYKTIISNKYKYELNKYVKANAHYIKSFTPVRVQVYFEYSDKGLGKSNMSRPQIVIDATYNAEIKVSEQFDIVGDFTKTMQDGFADKNFSLTQKGTTKDGYSNVVIRSVTRQVMR